MKMKISELVQCLINRDGYQTSEILKKYGLGKKDLEKIEKYLKEGRWELA